MPAVDVALCIDKLLPQSNRTPSEAYNRNVSALSSCPSPPVSAAPCQIHGEPGIVQRPKHGHSNTVGEETSFQGESFRAYPGYLVVNFFP